MAEYWGYISPRNQWSYFGPPTFLTVFVLALAQKGPSGRWWKRRLPLETLKPKRYHPPHLGKIFDPLKLGKVEKKDVRCRMSMSFLGEQSLQNSMFLGNLSPNKGIEIEPANRGNGLKLFMCPPLDFLSHTKNKITKNHWSLKKNSRKNQILQVFWNSGCWTSNAKNAKRRGPVSSHLMSC